MKAVDKKGNLISFYCINPKCEYYKSIQQGGVFDKKGNPRCNCGWLMSIKFKEAKD